MARSRKKVDLNNALGRVFLKDAFYFTAHFFHELNGKQWQDSTHFHLISERLNSILNGTHPTNNLIINMPPRAGKTQMSIINFTAMGFAINPASEFMMLSTSDLLTIQNVTNIRQIMTHHLYRAYYPNTVITNSGNSGITTSAGGKLYAAPFLGQIVGFGCGKLGADKFSGALLIDDPVKTQDALSETIRERVNFTWGNTIVSRKNDERTPVIITAQRTHQHDLCGYLIEQEGTIDEGGKWDVLKLPAITYDDDGVEHSIWPERLSIDYLHGLKKMDPWVFGTQYMQDPKPIEGLLFPESETRYYDEEPEDPDFVLCCSDPADTGKDHYCSKVYKVKNGTVYVTDCIYTTARFEEVLPRQVELIIRNKCTAVDIEAVSAWRLAAMRVQETLNEYGYDIRVKMHSETSNKEVRILNTAPTVRNRFLYVRPEKQSAEYAAMMRERHGYLKNVKDQSDDGVDTDCSAANVLVKSGIIPFV